jgi:peptide/nickel transport system permease protein
MLPYILKRLLYCIPIILGITLLTFFIMAATPGKPTDAMTELNPKITSQAKERLVKLYGLDKPVYVQYVSWLKRVLVLDFGNSFKDGQSVLGKIAQRLPATLLLNILSLAFIILGAVPIGIYCAVKKYSLGDRVLSFIVFVSFSAPAFWIALILMIIFGLWLGVVPISGIVSFDFSELSLTGKILDLGSHLILPVFVSSIASLAVLSRYIRSGMLDTLKQDYIKTAYAKGLTKKEVVINHALKNALLPLVTIIGLSIPGLIGGSFIIETIFSYPGMGRLGFEAIMARDYPVIMGIGIISAFLTLAGNIIADVLYAIADPRIRHK